MYKCLALLHWMVKLLGVLGLETCKEFFKLKSFCSKDSCRLPGYSLADCCHRFDIVHRYRVEEQRS